MIACSQSTIWWDGNAISHPKTPCSCCIFCRNLTLSPALQKHHHALVSRIIHIVIISAWRYRRSDYLGASQAQQTIATRRAPSNTPAFPALKPAAPLAEVVLEAELPAAPDEVAELPAVVVTVPEIIILELPPVLWAVEPEDPLVPPAVVVVSVVEPCWVGEDVSEVMIVIFPFGSVDTVAGYADGET
jgi:hypothetical protein